MFFYLNNFIGNQVFAGFWKCVSKFWVLTQIYCHYYSFKKWIQLLPNKKKRLGQLGLFNVRNLPSSWCCVNNFIGQSCIEHCLSVLFFQIIQIYIFKQHIFGTSIVMVLCIFFKKSTKNTHQLYNNLNVMNDLCWAMKHIIQMLKIIKINSLSKHIKTLINNE